MTVDCLNDAAAVIDITNESGEEIMLEGKDSWNIDKHGLRTNDDWIPNSLRPNIWDLDKVLVFVEIMID